MSSVGLTGAFQFSSELRSVRLYQSTGGLHIFVMAAEILYMLFILYYMFLQVILTKAELQPSVVARFFIIHASVWIQTFNQTLNMQAVLISQWTWTLSPRLWGEHSSYIWAFQFIFSRTHYSCLLPRLTSEILTWLWIDDQPILWKMCLLFIKLCPTDLFI